MTPQEVEKLVKLKHAPRSPGWHRVAFLRHENCVGVSMREGEREREIKLVVYAVNKALHLMKCMTIYIYIYIYIYTYIHIHTYIYTHTQGSEKV